ncbi:unnamed protein product [Ceutorhynchus assimilis]|uniref:Coiled-coil domain-containing protein 22 homolog n=1 Tax=Ceutorhynchus assimilis TaxID=467358 RepID=A0A9N9MDX1_9CUCU|nr:unnamed protein product [Ceutorhynchus assimilis]
MEEVDKIIIESLRNLNCEIDEDIDTLKKFTPDIVVAAISSCLASIDPQINHPKKLPPSMSSRIKFASDLAQQIKDLGFKGDMGYQTILYCNDVDVRRVLMFLLEHLPKESSTLIEEPIGYVPKIIKQIENSLKEDLGRFWLPSEVCDRGFGHCSPIDCVDLIVPSSVEEAALIPPVNLQCSTSQLLPSLLFEGAKVDWKDVEITSTKPLDDDIFVEDIVTTNQNTNEIIDELKQKKDLIIELRADVNANKEILAKLKQQIEEEQQVLETKTNTLKIKHKTLAVLSSEDNKLKLRNLVQKAENRLVELANQWSQVQTPLLQELETLKNSASLEHIETQKDQDRLQRLKQTHKELVADYKDKCLLEQGLIEKCKDLNSKNSRAAYTKRILEIVGNIQKQKKEIQKILLDTRRVQKDINSLTGQVDRSFTLSDELIFYDCKQEETSRRAYKLLAALREECNKILQAVTDMGQAERELRNLEEQLEIEKNKDFRDKLDKVQRDLAEIRKEIEMLEGK